MAFTNNNLPSPSQPWGREVQGRIEVLEKKMGLDATNSVVKTKQLETNVSRLNDSFLRLNTSSESKTSFKIYSGGMPDSIASSVSFTKPDWANTVTVIATAELYATSSGGESGALSSNVSIAIDNVTPVYDANPDLPEFDGKTVYSDIQLGIEYTDQRDSTSMSFSRSYRPLSDTVVVQLISTNSTFGSGASLKAGITATVFWGVDRG